MLLLDHQNLAAVLNWDAISSAPSAGAHAGGAGQCGLELPAERLSASRGASLRQQLDHLVGQVIADGGRHEFDFVVP